MFLVIVLKLILNILEKINKIFTGYSGVDDLEKKKGLRRFFFVVF